MRDKIGNLLFMLINIFGFSMLIWIPQLLYYPDLIKRSTPIYLALWPTYYVIGLFFYILPILIINKSKRIPKLDITNYINRLSFYFSFFSIWPLLVIIQYRMPIFQLPLFVLVHSFPVIGIIIGYVGMNVFELPNIDINPKFNTKYKEHIPLIVAIIFTHPVRIRALKGNSVWRETQTLMMIRNMARDNLNIFFPRLSIISQPGDQYIGTTNGEFPIFQFFMAVFYRIGLTNIALIIPFSISIWSIFLFWKILNIHTDDLTIKTIVLFSFSLLPYSITYSTAIMPDWLNLNLIMLSYLNTIKWVKSQSLRNSIALSLSLIFVSLSKITGLYIILLTSYQIIAYLVEVNEPQNKKYFSRNQIIIILKYLLILLPVIVVSILWYVIWSPNLLKYGGVDLVTPISDANRRRIPIILSNPSQIAEFVVFISFYILQPLISLFMILGIIKMTIKFKSNRSNMNLEIHALFWFLGVVIYTIALLGANQINRYYQISFIIPAHLVVLSLLKGNFEIKGKQIQKIVFVSFIIILISALYIPRNYSNFATEDEYNIDRMNTGYFIQSITNSEDYIATNDNGNPAILYWADRTGWTGWQFEYTLESISEMIVNGLVLLIWNVDISMNQGVASIIDSHFDQKYNHKSNQFLVFAVVG